MCHFTADSYYLIQLTTPFVKILATPLPSSMQNGEDATEERYTYSAVLNTYSKCYSFVGECRRYHVLVRWLVTNLDYGVFALVTLLYRQEGAQPLPPLYTCVCYNTNVCIHWFV